MTVEELVQYCEANGISLKTPIALRAKDDYLLVEENIETGDHPYFGNCDNGGDWLRENAPKTPDGDIDFDNLPLFLILDTGR